MEPPRDLEGSTRGKVLQFAPRPDSGATATHGANAAEVLERRHKLRPSWTTRTWLALAWIVAVDRLQHAIGRAEVFGWIDSVAFLVAVIMPLAHAKSAVRALVESGLLLRQARAERVGRALERR